VLLYGYCIGVRSSRQIERRLNEDIAFRVLAGNQSPDHVTIARFRPRHEQALAGFLVASLKLCAAAGMVRVGTVALDGTKLAGNAAERAATTSRWTPWCSLVHGSLLAGRVAASAGVWPRKYAATA
jgi:transposase